MANLIDSVRSDMLLSRYAPRIVYVLSGGSSKGFCHLGMIEALEKRGIRPDFVVGTSAGALFGSLYCHFGSVQGVQLRVREVLDSSEFADFSRKYLGEKNEKNGESSKWRQFVSTVSGKVMKGIMIGQTLATQSMIHGRDVSAIFAEIFRGIDFESLKIPFAAVATDLLNATPAIFSSTQGANLPGKPSRPSLAKAVMASTAIPFLFPAVDIGGIDCADGYMMANLPVREARSLAGGRVYVAAFDVSSPLARKDDEFSSFELALRLLDLAAGSKQAADRELADICYRPVDRDYPWSSFGEYESFIELGSHYMGGERIDAFLSGWREACARAIAAEGNPLRRFLAARRLSQMRAAP
jgi:NTE family protein